MAASRKAVPAALLLAWWLGHHAWTLAPVELEGHAWNVGGAAKTLVLLGLIAVMAWNPVVHTVLAWLAAEEVQAIGCTVAYVLNPWPMAPGEEKCSAALGLPLQTACLVALLWCGAWLLDTFREKRS